MVAGALAAALAYEFCAGVVLLGALVLLPFVSRFLAPKLLGAWSIALPFCPITVVASLPSRITCPACTLPRGKFEVVAPVWGVAIVGTMGAGAGGFGAVLLGGGD